MDRLKSSIKRETFRKLIFLKDLSQMLIQVNNMALNKKEFYKCRTGVYQIIAILWLDDFHDNYIENLNELVKNIKTLNFENNSVSKVITIFNMQIQIK